MKTILSDRILWFDGTSEVDSFNLSKIKLKGATKIAVSSITEDIILYNKFAIQQLNIKEENTFDDNLLDFSIPDNYKYLDTNQYFVELFYQIENDELYENRIKRFEDELYLFNSSGLYTYIPVLKYIIDTMDKNNHIMGIGRGSSTSSYLLYLMGFHLVDCVKYDINIKDFIKE